MSNGAFQEAKEMTQDIGAGRVVIQGIKCVNKGLNGLAFFHPDVPGGGQRDWTMYDGNKCPCLHGPGTHSLDFIVFGQQHMIRIRSGRHLLQTAVALILDFERRCRTHGNSVENRNEPIQDAPGFRDVYTVCPGVDSVYAHHHMGREWTCRQIPLAHVELEIGATVAQYAANMPGALEAIAQMHRVDTTIKRYCDGL